MRRYAIVISSLSVLLLFLAVPQAFSQEPAGIDSAGEDPFDTGAFDTAVNEGVKTDESSKIQIQAGGSFTGNLSVVSDAGFAGWAWARLSGRPFVKVVDPRTGQLFLSLNISNSIFQSLNDSAWSGIVPGDDLYSLEYSLAEFFLSFDIAKAVYFRLGNQLSAWGPSFFWTPVDFVNLERSTGFESLDLRQGIPSAKIQIPAGLANITAFVDWSDSTTPGLITDFLSGTNLALRLDLTTGGFAWGLTGFIDSGSGILSTKYGFDVSGNLFGINLYTEQAIALHYTTADMRATWDGYQASAGFDFAFGELKDWNIRAEFFYNSEGTSDTAGAGPAFVPFYTGIFYIYARISADKFPSDAWTVSLAGIANLSDNSFTIRFANNLTFPGVIPFSITAGFSSGDQGDEFTPVVSPVFQLDLEISMDF